jgi:uncharacterized protein YacL
MVLWIFRAIFVLASAGTAYSIGRDLGQPFNMLVAGIAVSVLAIAAEALISRGPIALISSIVFGALLGLLFATLTVSVLGLALPAELMAMPGLREDLTGALVVIYTYLGIAFIYQSRDKFNLIVPYVEFRREKDRPRPVVLDTNVIIDGRIGDLLRTGIFDGPVLVPQVVLQELHQIADSDDKLRRDRGRLGLDILNKAMEDPELDVRIQDVAPDEERPVDQQLIRIAKMVNGRLMTNDFNLNRMATLEGVSVVNLNELANAVKPIALPDEQIRVKLLKPGEQPGQGIAYLQDGTMVVVEDAVHMVGQEVEVVVTNTITRETGRIVFARRIGAGSGRRSDR